MGALEKSADVVYAARASLEGVASSRAALEIVARTSHVIVAEIGCASGKGLIAYTGTSSAMAAPLPITPAIFGPADLKPTAAAFNGYSSTDPTPTQGILIGADTGSVVFERTPLWIPPGRRLIVLARDENEAVDIFVRWREQPQA